MKEENVSGIKRPTPLVNENPDIVSLLLPSLYRLTGGLPRRELKLMVSEAVLCEAALEQEIRALQDALDNEGMSHKPPVATMLETEVTPVDRFFTVSALLGRLRDGLATPLPPNSSLQRGKADKPPLKKKKKENSLPVSTQFSHAAMAPKPSCSLHWVAHEPLERQRRLLSIGESPMYHTEHADATELLAVWKKITAHRSSVVFRRPVNPKEAPAYTERIFFPMDLSVIRKMILARQITSFAELSDQLGLIAHNCVQYNGRESDYGIVTREFEAFANEAIAVAVLESTDGTQYSTGALKPSAPTSYVRLGLKASISAINSPIVKESDGNSKPIGAPTTSGTNAADCDTLPEPS